MTAVPPTPPSPPTTPAPPTAPTPFRFRFDEQPSDLLPGWQPPPMLAAATPDLAAPQPTAVDLAAFTNALDRLSAPTPHTPQQVHVHLTQRWQDPLHIASVTRQADGSIALSLATTATTQHPAAPPPLITLPPRLRALLDTTTRPRPLTEDLL